MILSRTDGVLLNFAGRNVMNLTKVHHVAVIGTNYEKSKHFYVDLLGFKVIREIYREQRDDYKIDLRLADCELELKTDKFVKAYRILQ